VLADLVASGLGPQGMSWQTSPAATEVENVVMEWLRQMLGLPADFSGVIHDSASSATFCALLCARERTTGFSQNHGGLQSQPAPLVVYASDQAHSSVPKAALLAGFGTDNLRLLGTDDSPALRRLERIVGRLESGEVPLQDALDLYERGDQLRRQCAARLDAVVTVDRGELITVLNKACILLVDDETAILRVLRTIRPKYACRACEGTVVQAKALPRLIENTRATVTARNF